MAEAIPSQMRAVAIDHFGGPEVLHVEQLPVPRPKAGEVLIRLESAGVGVWDPAIRSGEWNLGPSRFPLVIGNDGAGTVVAVGDRVYRFREGDRVYAFSYSGGFYAEYAAVKESDVAPLPEGISAREAGALGADGITALRGLEDELHLKDGDTLLIFGASGGIGHLAVQLAKRMGARVFAVASGPDGVALVKRLGADEAVDGKGGAVGEAAAAFAPDGFDAALILASGEKLAGVLEQLKGGARVAYPNGVEPEPIVPRGKVVRAYDGTPSPESFVRLNRWIAAGPFHVELGRVYPLDRAEQAHRELRQHHLGKIALTVH